MQSILAMDLPWRKLKSKLVKSTGAGMVIYRSTFELTVHNKLKEKVVFVWIARFVSAFAFRGVINLFSLAFRRVVQ